VDETDRRPPLRTSETRHYVPGSDSGGHLWAIVATLIQTAKLNEVDPLAWLTDVLERIVSGRTKHNELSALLPWTWKNNNPVVVNTG
jgi:transposase